MYFICCCATNDSKFSGLRKQFISQFLQMRNPGVAQLVSYALQSVCYLKAQLRKYKLLRSLMWLLTGFISMRAVEPRLSSSLTRGWRLSFVPYYVCLSLYQFTRQLVSSERTSKGQERVCQQDGNQSCNLSQKSHPITIITFSSSEVTWYSSHSWRGNYKVHEYHEGGEHWKPFQKLPTLRYNGILLNNEKELYWYTQLCR